MGTRRRVNMFKLWFSLALVLVFLASGVIFFRPWHETTQDPIVDAFTSANGAKVEADLHAAQKVVLAYAIRKNGGRVQYFSTRPLSSWVEPFCAEFGLQSELVQLKVAANRSWWYDIPKELHGKDLSKIELDEILIRVNGLSEFAGVRKYGMALPK